MLKMTRLDASQRGFSQRLGELLAWESVSDPRVQQTVSDILQRVKTQGDKALLQFTKQLDRANFASVAELEISQEHIQNSIQHISLEEYEALKKASQRIRTYHEKQKQDSWRFNEADGSMLGQKITPLDRVGIYVPGGKASYPSSVLMNAIPAKVAGVTEIIMSVPMPNGIVNPLVMAAASVAGVDRVFAIGGAQAIAAMAYGTQLIPKVDKIVGPGNIYVATAKRAVFGTCGIDMIAGPSEILIYCDGKTNPDWIAMDLFSQAEHDENAQAILICEDENYLNQVEKSLQALLPSLDRKDIAAQSLRDRGAFIKVTNRTQAIDLINRIAPEHLELSIDDPESMIPEIRHAGAIFMGKYSAEALGDYCAGPNHVLPTSGTARFSSPLGVYDFQKRSSLIMFSSEGAAKLGKIASVLANGEGLGAHARSAEYRIK